MKDYVGARWLKCDFHLHTPASDCFKDKTVTAEAWVQACIDQKLDCVAVTDHNTNAFIDKIKTAAAGTNLTVFPGVELTCDTSKVHVLVLFDKNKTGQDVYDFLISCGIARDSFASPEAQSELSCLSVVEKANAAGALVIPAHIDEFSGLGQVSKKTIRELFDKEEILAVQYVTQQFKDSSLKIDGEFGREYNRKYGRTEGTIGLQLIKDYYYCVQEAIHNNISLVSFSDNPDSEEPSKHGLSGIGKSYTWIKMDKDPSLEGLRQALMIPDRVIPCFDSVAIPYKEPSLWIKSIEVTGTTITREPLKVEFNPQLNTIIGGRGSGKSSVFRFLRGAFQKISDLNGLHEIQNEQEQFFQKPTDDRGVLKDDTVIDVEFVRDQILHKVHFKMGDNNKVFRFEDGQWIEVTEKSYISFFDFEQYTQKQIFAIAKHPNALRELIDTGSEEIDQLKREEESLVAEYVKTYNELKTAQGYTHRVEFLNTEIKDLRQKIDNLKSSNITAIAQKQVQFSKLHERIENFFGMMQMGLAHLSESANDELFPVFNYDDFDEAYKNEIHSIMTPLETSSTRLVGTIQEEIKTSMKSVQDAYEAIQKTQFEKDRVLHNETFENKKKELLERGIDDISNYQLYTEKLKLKENELKMLYEITSQITLIEKRLVDIRNSIFDRHEEISQKRQDIVDKLSTDKVKINVKRKSDSKKFERQFREIIQKDRGYGDDIETISELCFPVKPVDFKVSYQNIIDDLYRIRKNGVSSLSFSGWFVRMIRELDDEQMARIETLIPDDQIDVLYKPNGSSSFRSIVTASAGQKTTAVLTYILSQGTIPLLLDQPEDDLDNRLVCDLVVEKIKNIKEKRQVIVITHNANIPVIGDAEYIVSMDSTSRFLKIHTEGMIEKIEVKKEICDIMEGGEEAFALRAARYKSILNKR